MHIIIPIHTRSLIVPKFLLSDYYRPFNARFNKYALQLIVIYTNYGVRNKFKRKYHKSEDGEVVFNLPANKTIFAHLLIICKSKRIYPKKTYRLYSWKTETIHRCQPELIFHIKPIKNTPCTDRAQFRKLNTNSTQINASSAPLSTSARITAFMQAIIICGDESKYVGNSLAFTKHGDHGSQTCISSNRSGSLHSM